MSETTNADRLVEVRLRYRPVGDVLTAQIRPTQQAGYRIQTESGGNTLLEWLALPSGASRLAAVQIIGATERSHRLGKDLSALLPDNLWDEANDLIDPGRRHAGHPSTRRSMAPTLAIDRTVHVSWVGHGPSVSSLENAASTTSSGSILRPRP